VKKKSHASIATKTKNALQRASKMPPKRKSTKKGGFLPLLMLPGGLMGLTALMSKMGGPQGSGLVGGRRKR
jgi:hypothetical protein